MAYSAALEVKSVLILFSFIVGKRHSIVDEVFMAHGYKKKKKNNSRDAY